MNDINDHKGAKRLADIERRLDKLQADRELKDRPSQATLPEGMAAIMGRVATELVAGVVVGTFIGWMLDRWLEQLREERARVARMRPEERRDHGAVFIHRRQGCVVS